MPHHIPHELETIYRQEVTSLLEEIKIFSKSIQHTGELEGEMLLREACMLQQEESSCDTLEWVVDELRGILYLQGGLLRNNPQYATQAIEELLARCYEKLGATPLQTATEVRKEIARKREEGFYHSQAELMQLSQEIEAMMGNAQEKQDIEELATRLEMEDFTRKMAALAPAVQKERERLGKIQAIRLSGDITSLLDTFSPDTVH